MQSNDESYAQHHLSLDALVQQIQSVFPYDDATLDPLPNVAAIRAGHSLYQQWAFEMMGSSCGLGVAAKPSSVLIDYIWTNVIISSSIHPTIVFSFFDAMYMSILRNYHHSEDDSSSMVSTTSSKTAMRRRARGRSGDSAFSHTFLLHWIRQLEEMCLQKQQQQQGFDKTNPSYSITDSILSACSRVYALDRIVNVFRKNASDFSAQDLKSDPSLYRDLSRRGIPAQYRVMWAQNLLHSLFAVATSPTMTWAFYATLSPVLISSFLHSLEDILVIWNYLKRLVWNTWSQWQESQRFSWVRWMLRFMDVAWLFPLPSKTIWDSFWQDWTDWVAEMARGSNQDSLIVSLDWNKVWTVQLPCYLSLQQTPGQHPMSAAENSSIHIVNTLFKITSAATTSYISALACWRLFICSALGMPFSPSLFFKLRFSNNNPLRHSMGQMTLTMLHVNGNDGDRGNHLLASPAVSNGAENSPTIAAYHWMELFTSNWDVVDEVQADAPSDFIYGWLAQISDFSHTHFSARQQLAALSFGLGLLDDRNYSPDLGFTFLTNLLTAYTHLAVHALLFVSEKLFKMLSQCQKDYSVGQRLLQYLNFICCPQLLANPHCAAEVWDLFSNQWLSDAYNVPVTLRVVLTRLLPRMVVGNSQLYHPALEQIVMNLTTGTTTFELRLAAVTSIADLAAGGHIRDAFDVIYWFKSFMVPVSEIKDSPQLALLAHYALMTLHHLLVSRQLDFHAVITFLDKTLCCQISSHEALLQFPLVVLEALVLVLGDGECCNPSDAQDFDEIDDVFHSASFIQVLLHVGRSLQQQNDDSNVYRRIRGNVIQSLSKNSLRTLGVDGNAIRNATFSTQEEKKDETDLELEMPYGLLRHFLLFEVREFPCRIDDPETCKALHDLVSKLLSLEEAALGSKLWRDKTKSELLDQTKRKPVTSTPNQSNSMVSVIQTIKQDLSKQFGDFTPSSSTSIATLLSSDGSRITDIRDHADASLDVKDPLIVVLSLQGFLSATSCLVSELSKPIGVLLSEISTWYDIFVSPDAMHLILSCFVIFVPVDSREPGSEKSYVEEIYDTVQEAILSNDFERRDLVGICLGLLGHNCLRYADLDRINKIIDQIMTCRSDNIDASFGVYYGLGLIANACPKFVKDDLPCQISSFDIKGIVSRINGFLLEQLVSCFDGDGREPDLISCTKQGKVTSTLVESVLTMRPSSLSLIQSKKTLARQLFLSCAISIPSLTIVNNYLLLAVFRFLESLEWGCGKGLLMPSVVHACHEAAVDGKLLQSIYQNYVLSLSIRLECFEATELSDELGDIFFALKGARWRVPLDPDGKLSSLHQKSLVAAGQSQILVAYALSFTSISCFGTTSMEKLTAFDENCDGDDFKIFVDMLFRVVASSDKSEHVEIAQILMGLLASVSTRKHIADNNLPTDDYGWKHAREIARLLSYEIKPNDDYGSTFEIANLPRPQPQTLLAGICSVFETLHVSFVLNQRQSSSLSNALQILCTLRTPENFVRILIEHLLHKNIATEAAVKFLCSQAKLYGKAFSEDPCFITVATQLCASTDQKLHEWTPSEETQIAVLYNIIEFLPALSISDYLHHLWNKCCHSVSPKSSILLGLFLTGIQKILSNDPSSRKKTPLVQEFVLGTLYRDIQHMPPSKILLRSTQDSESILHNYVGCLQKIPLVFVDAAKLLGAPMGNDSFSSGFFRAVLVLELVITGYFDDRRGSQELEAVASWIAKCTLSFRNDNADEEAFRRIVCAFGLATRVPSMSLMHQEMLTSILDLALFTNAENGRFVLDLLAVVVAFWTSDIDSGGDLSMGFLCMVDTASIHQRPLDQLTTFFNIVVHELPWNLAALMHRERIEISDRLIRWLTLWTDDAIGVNQKYIRILERVVLKCHVNRGTEEDDMVVNMASQMIQNQNDATHF